MKGLLITLMLLVTTPAVAMGLDPVQKKLRDTPEMSKRCVERIGHYTEKVKEYQKKVDVFLVKRKKPRTIDRLKLGYFKMEVRDWTNYCTGKPAED